MELLELEVGGDAEEAGYGRVCCFAEGDFEKVVWWLAKLLLSAWHCGLGW